MQARANFFEIKIIATLRKEQQFLLIFLHIKNSNFSRFHRVFLKLLQGEN